MTSFPKNGLPVIFCAVLVCLPRLLYAAPPKQAASKPAWKAQSNTLPLQSGPGIFLCEPVTASTNHVGSNFGTGCALWLQMTVGGQPQFGKTPLWGVPARAAAEMGRSDLQLSSIQAQNLAPILGVTHAGIATLSGASPHLTLTYRLLQVPQGTQIGAPITLTGTQEQIIEGLPSVARTLAQRLGEATPNIPASPGLKPAELQRIGQMQWAGTTLTADERTDLYDIASRSPLAGLLILSQRAYSSHARFNTSAQTLLAQAGGNALIWGEVAVEGDVALLPHTAELTALTAHYPGNYNLATAETFRFRALKDRKSEIQAAERIVQDAPHNPDGWLTYASSTSSVAADLRQARGYNALTPEESDTLSHLYPQWEAAAERAAELDPAYGKAWLRLAQAAAFNSDGPLADHALQNALVKSADKADVYGWAMEMYQPKWNDEPANLTHIAHVAAADMTLSASETIYVAQHLGGSGFSDLRRQVLNGFIARQRDFLAAHPGDGNKHWGLAMALNESGDTKDALAEYRLAATLLPESAIVRYELGDALYQQGEIGFTKSLYEQAVAQLQEAVRIDPDYLDAYIDLAYCQKNLRHFAEAKQAVKEGLRLDPASGSTYAVLGEVLMREHNYAEAIPNYQDAIRYGHFSQANYDNLTTMLAETGQYDLEVTTGEAAMRVYSTMDPDFYDDMADAYLHKKDWDQSHAMSQTAIALKPEDPIAYENLAEAYLGAGRIADAQVEWRKVLMFKDDRIKAVAQDYLNKYPN